ncbi:hypothetical protein FRB90_002703 [Tulasnella sp. 427]|nr:hypothetical protein FRB90_002703 [Tulasnella sp. 427]
MASTKQQLLLPAIHLNTRTTQAERWAAFDSFHPSEIEQDFTSLVASPRYNFNASSDSDTDDHGHFLHSLKERRIQRAAELRTRAKARLMPPFDYSTRQTRRMHRVGAVGVDAHPFATPERVVSPRNRDSPAATRDHRRLAYRTPSPSPMSSRSRRAPSPATPRTPRVPTSPMTPSHTPASTVAHRSPVPTPYLPMCLNSSSP